MRFAEMGLVCVYDMYMMALNGNFENVLSYRFVEDWIFLCITVTPK